MQKKLFLQIFLLLIILLISIIFFRVYFGNNITDRPSDNNKIKSDNLPIKESNLIYNIQYISEDKEGNSYIINSKFGKVDSDKQEIVYLKKVTATISLKNSGQVNIYADNAVYNNINYNTNFYENVSVVYSEHHITSDNLDLDFKKNLATVFNNISYKNLNTKLQADKIEIDLITKNSKIFMFNKSEKVKIVSIN
tara:strand:+ start:68 stop:652 length:585 start_codon:yes stop_codon:yes gene_type:complete